MTVAHVISLGLAVVACGWDLRTRRIPQLLTLGGALAGLVYHFAFGGWNAGLAQRDGVAGWHRHLLRAVRAGWAWRRRRQAARCTSVPGWAR